MYESEALSRRQRQGRSIGSMLASLLMAALVAGLIVRGGLDVLAQEATPESAGTGSTVQTTDNRSIADVVEEANPAVVTIRAALELAYPDMHISPDDPFNIPPFGGRGVWRDQQPIQVSTGSGFIIDEAGHVVTNAHVVAGATDFEVELYDGTVVSASLVGYDLFTDVAVIQLDLSDGQSVPGFLPLGDSDGLRVGDQVIDIGTPLGEYTNTVSAGIVGAKGRSLETGSGYLLEDVIQHDAPIYSGNSGGPLLNLAGEVVGINTAKAASRLLGAADPEIGLALAINSVKDEIEQIIASGTVERPYLGIEGRPLPDGHGVLSVAAGSPAETAGLERGDIITAVDGQPVDTEHPLVNLLFAHAPGDTVSLTVDRDGDELTLTVTLGQRTAEMA